MKRFLSSRTETSTVTVVAVVLNVGASAGGKSVFGFLNSEGMGARSGGGGVLSFGFGFATESLLDDCGPSWAARRETTPPAESIASAATAVLNDRIFIYTTSARRHCTRPLRFEFCFRR